MNTAIGKVHYKSAPDTNIENQVIPLRVVYFQFLISRTAGTLTAKHFICNFYFKKLRLLTNIAYGKK